MQQQNANQWNRGIRGTLLFLFVLILSVFSKPELVSAEAISACPQGSSCLFVPFVAGKAGPKNPSGSQDLALNDVEITQAVQDTANSVPLVAGRATALRIFATTTTDSEQQSAQSVDNVQVQVTATREGVKLSNSPTSFKSSIPLSNSRADSNSTLNMSLPNDWLSGTIDLTVKLDPGNTVSESNEDNNTMSIRLTFNEVPALRIKIVPINYTHTPNGHSYAAPTKDTISDWMYRIYPVSKIEVSWHSVYTFTGNLSESSDWYKLLDEVTALKSSEGAASSEVYYGLIPVSDEGSTWFNGGIAGIGWVGSRTSVGLNTTSSASQVAAHEIGHNLGMWHSPCGNASGVDPDYPYSNGSIGAYGMDVATGKIYTPDANRDLMSYCNPKWISDYTYKGILNNQMQYGVNLQASLAAPLSASQHSLLIRAQVNDQGVNFLPSYILPGQANNTNDGGEYLVQMFDEQGNLLTEAPVQAKIMGLDDAEVAAIHAVVPLPDSPVAKIRLVKDGQPLVEQNIQMDGNPAAMSVRQSGENQIVQWENPDQPAMLRYTTDGGKTWTTLGVDLTGGEMVITPAMLPEAGGEFQVITGKA